MLSVPRAKIDKSGLRAISGVVKLRPKGKHPALKALAYFANRLQALGYPFTERDRGLYNEGKNAVKARGFIICPNCGGNARFLTIHPKAKIKAWFCKCSYEDSHSNGCSRHD